MSTPILLASTGELISERAGILNVGLEGMVLSGAFFAFAGAHYSESHLVGFLAGALGGIILSVLMAALAIHVRADQIVVGIGLNILALGVTTFAFRELFSGPQVILERPGTVRVPILASIPGIGEVLFDQPAPIYLSFLVVPVAWFLLQRTSWGLSIRGAGEKPEAVDAAGGKTALVRWAATMLAGLGAGLAGAYLSLELGIFVEGMSAGKGFLALAAVIFGRWRIVGVFGAALLFGAADALQVRLQAERFVPAEVWMVLGIGLLAIIVIMFVRGRRARQSLPLVALAVLAFALFVLRPEWSPPAQLWRAMPFLLSLVVLGGFVGRSRMPSALASAYDRASV